VGGLIASREGCWRLVLRVKRQRLPLGCGGMAGSILEELGGALVKRNDDVEGRGEKYAWRALLHGCSVGREEEDSRRRWQWLG